MKGYLSHDMGDLCAVFLCIATGGILVLQWFSIILYILIYINEMVAQGSKRALNLFLAWTVTVEQSDRSPIGNWLVDDCPHYSSESSSLLEEGSSSSKDGSHYQSLISSLMANPE